MRKSFPRKVAVFLGVTLLAGGLLRLVLGEEGNRSRAARRAARARRVLAALDDLSAGLEEVAFRRDVLARGDEPGRQELFASSVRRARATLERLRALTRQDPALASRLLQMGALAEKAFSPSGAPVRLVNLDQPDGPGVLPASASPGPRLCRTLAALRSEVGRSRDKHLRDAWTHARQADLLVGGGVLFAALCLTLSGVITSRRFLAVDRRREAAARRAEEQSARLGETQAALTELADLRGRLEEQLAQTRRLASVGRVTSGVAHDFNNLLTPILGCSEAALHVLPPDEPARSYIGEVVQAACRAAVLVRQLLRAGRAGEPGPLDLNRAVADVEPLLRRLAGRDVELRTALDPSLGPVVADAGELGQVLLNLVANARDAMPRGGRLTLETARAAGDPPRAVLAVTDNGCGMDGPTRARLFEAFFTTKEQGTGLGMAIVRDAAHRWGARVEVDSEPGQGTTVRILLRPAPETPASQSNTR